MSLMEIFLIGIGLSMDAFAVAICKGLSMQKVDLRYTVWIALYFGVFQAAMPLTGWLLGSQFARHVTRFAPWIAFILLALIGGNMIRESLSKDEEEAERKASWASRVTGRSRKMEGYDDLDPDRGEDKK